MESILSSLDSQIQYLSHEFMADQVVFRAKTRFVTAICPYCGVKTNKIHSKYRRVFQDIPISTFKTVIHLELPKFFCLNIHCPYATFSAPLSFIEPKARKTKRLEKEILTLSLEMSSINCAKRLNQQNIKISKSTICRLIKKRNYN
ncbi:TPA: transposase family protein [Bacillus thuringiensis]|nr:transposase family protein [Bacillus thuringiensis]